MLIPVDKILETMIMTIMEKIGQYAILNDSLSSIGFSATTQLDLPILIVDGSMINGRKSGNAILIIVGAGREINVFNIVPARIGKTKNRYIDLDFSNPDIALILDRKSINDGVSFRKKRIIPTRAKAASDKEI